MRTKFSVLTMMGVRIKHYVIAVVVYAHAPVLRKELGVRPVQRRTARVRVDCRA